MVITVHSKLFSPVFLGLHNYNLISEVKNMVKRRKVVEKMPDAEEPQHTGEPMLEGVPPEEIEPQSEETTVKVEEEPELPKDMVKVKVLAGTLGWSGGYYEKGEIFIISKEDLKRFDPRYYQIIE